MAHTKQGIDAGEAAEPALAQILVGRLNAARLIAESCGC